MTEEPPARLGTGADIEWAAEQVKELLHLLEADSEAWNTNSGDLSQRLELKYSIERRLLTIRRIAESFEPGLADDLVLIRGQGWPWESVRRTASLLLGVLERRAEADMMLGPTGPQIAAERLHPWVWESAASLWDVGARREALQAAATQLDLQLQAKVERNDITGAELVTRAFTLEEPRTGETRLRLPGFTPGSEQFRSVHQGAMSFGQGCFRAIRNIATHDLTQPEELIALEQLAALSVLARWIDNAEVVGSSAQPQPAQQEPS